MRQRRNATTVVCLDTFRLALALLSVCCSNAAVNSDSEPDVKLELVAFAVPLKAGGAGICCDFGQMVSSLPRSCILVPSFVPSLVREYFAQLGKPIICCCGTLLSG